MKIWNNDEVKNLFCEVEKCKQKNAALKRAFASHAKAFKRKPNSVRNYYYKEVENLAADEKRRNVLGVDLSKHTKNHFKCFEKDEEKSLMGQIEELKKQGLSVRLACQKLSGGDLSLMTRLQNKYQNMKKQTSPQVDNVVVFQKKQKLLTEADLNGLVMGIVKLIKKTAIEEFEQKQNEKNLAPSSLLKKALLDLNKKDAQLLQQRLQLQKIQEENEKLKEKLQEAQSDKTQALKKHLQKQSGQMLKKKEI